MFSTLALAAATFTSLTSAQFAYDPKTATDGQSVTNSRDGLQVQAAVEIGCFSAPGPDMNDMGIYTFQSPGWCQPLCIRLGMPIFALVNGTNCFCGMTQPLNKFKVDSSHCNTPCNGTNAVTCGGTNYWDVQNDAYQQGDPTGSQKITIPTPTWTWTGAPLQTTASSTSSSTVAATIVVTAAPSADPSATATPTAQPSNGGANKAAIAGGIVVAVVVVAAIIGGVFFYMRRSKQRALAEEQRRHEMMTSFVTGEKPGSGYTSPDSRLDPSMMFQRRLSDGSIRDNEDYSRRILKVANPDA